MAQITAVNVVHEVRPDAHNDGGRTAIDKRAVAGAVPLGALGLAGDQQMDVKHHGGRDKAVYAYASEDVAWWAAELERDLTPGQFGENLTTSGIDVTNALIGERWRIGGPGGVVVEVTEPRIPCATFKDWLGEPRWVRRFTEHGAPGAYLRVVVEGMVTAGDDIEVVHRPEHGVSIGASFVGLGPDVGRRLLDAAATGQLDLAHSLRAYAERAVARA